MRSAYGLISVPVFAVSLMTATTYGRPFSSSLKECSPPSYDSSLETIGKWGEEIDLIGNFAARKTEDESDLRLPTGTVLAKSCQAGARLARIKAALSYMMTQAYRCEKTLGLPAAAEVISIIRRARMTCEPQAHGQAKNKNVNYKPLIAPFANVNTSYDKSYLINLTPTAVDAKNFDVVSLAGSLFHEGLHSTASNNHSDWHNRTVEVGKSSTGCKGSIFEDRIYFQQAACFPRSDWGNILRPLLTKCSGLCESAFTQSVPVAKYTQAKGTGSITALGGGSIGPVLNATPLKPEAAKVLCDRIRKTLDSRDLITNEINESLERINAANTKLKGLSLSPQTQSAATLALHSRLNKIAFRVSDSIHRQKNISANLKTITTLQDELKTFIEQTCADSGRPLDWSGLCALKGSVILSETQSWINGLRYWENRDADQAKMGLAGVSEIRDFYDGPVPTPKP